MSIYRARSNALTLRLRNRHVDISSKSFGVNSRIAQIIRQGIPDGWSGEQKIHGTDRSWRQGTTKTGTHLLLLLLLLRNPTIIALTFNNGYSHAECSTETYRRTMKLRYTRRRWAPEDICQRRSRCWTIETRTFRPWTPKKHNNLHKLCRVIIRFKVMSDMLQAYYRDLSEMSWIC